MATTNFTSFVCPASAVTALNTSAKVNFVDVAVESKNVTLTTPDDCQPNDFYVRPINCVSPFEVVLTPASGLIDGQASINIGCEPTHIFFDGTNWWILSNYN